MFRLSGLFEPSPIWLILLFALSITSSVPRLFARFVSAIPILRLSKSFEFPPILRVLLSALSAMFVVPRLSTLSASIMFVAGSSALLMSTIPMPSCAYAHICLSLYFFSLLILFLIFYCKSQPRIFLTIELINLYSIMSISPIIFSFSRISNVITLGAFMEYKNLMLGILGLTTHSHIMTNSALTI